MKLPSVLNLVTVFIEILKRYPLVMASAAIGSFSMSYLIEHEGVEIHHTIKLIFTAALGIPLFLSAALLSRRWARGGWVRLVPHLLALTVLVLFYATFRVFQYNSPAPSSLLVFFLLNIAAHLAISVIPWVGRGAEGSFWEYNKTLLLNLAVGVLYSGVVYAGLSIAIAAMNELFELKIDGSIYGHLFFFIGSIFTTSWFLAHFPEREVEQGQMEVSQLPLLHILVKYILIPIVTIYMVILYAYSAKIIVHWELPRGWVASLVLGFSVAGILTWLLNHQERIFDKGVVMDYFHRWYFPVLLPMTALLFVAIGRRISDYGVTEMRYVVAITGVWLLVSCLYFIFAKKVDIRFIPLSLIVVALLTAVGPLSARSVSTRSQIHRLEKLLAQANMLEEGKIVAFSDSSKIEQALEIRNIFQYLRDWNKLSLVAHMHDAIPADGKMSYEEWDAFMTSLKLPASKESGTPEIYCNYNFEQPASFSTSGPSTVYIVNLSPEDLTSESNAAVRVEGDTIVVQDSVAGSWVLPLNDYLDSLRNDYGCSPPNVLPPEAGEFRWRFDSVGFKLMLRNLNVKLEFEDPRPRLEYANGFLLLERIEQ